MSSPSPERRGARGEDHPLRCPADSWINRTTRFVAGARTSLSSAQDNPRAAQCAHSKTHVVPRETLSSHFHAQLCLGRTRCVLARARSSHERSRSPLGRARSICRPAQSIVGPSQSAICKVWWSSGRARSISHTATCARAESRCIASAARSTFSRARPLLPLSRSAHTKTEDTHFETRTARTDNENTRGGFCRPSPPYYLAAASPPERRRRIETTTNAVSGGYQSLASRESPNDLLWCLADR